MSTHYRRRHPELNRTITISLRLTPNQHHSLLDAARADRTSLSSYIRQRLAQPTPKTPNTRKNS